MLKTSAIPKGTLRIKTSDFKVYEKKRNGWKKSNKKFPNAEKAIKLFKAHDNFKFLIDKKNSQFLKGQISGDGKIQGARINILPDGKALNKAYSIFAEDLTIHDESSNDHWDVIYKNPGGKYAYVYTLDKIKNSKNHKYQVVEEFSRKYNLIHKKVLKALNNTSDELALPMYTLLKTYMRVGNEAYYKTNGHKGLTTLKRKDISIKGNKVIFDYLAKDGVPQLIEEEFPSQYIKRLKKEIKNLKNSDFVFAKDGHPLKDTHFMEAFEKYCGTRFYPHIVRSYYATQKAKNFLKTHKKTTKQEVKELYNSIAEKLGHKKFDKKSKEWKDSYNVTIHYYLKPKILEEIESITKSSV